MVLFLGFFVLFYFDFFFEGKDYTKRNKIFALLTLEPRNGHW